LQTEAGALKNGRGVAFGQASEDSHLRPVSRRLGARRTFGAISIHQPVHQPIAVEINRLRYGGW
jgi:hypothetical protein